MSKNDKKTAATTSNPATESAPSTELAPTEEAGQLQALGEYEKYAGAGFENQDAQDFAIPFLGVLQALSPQVQENSDLRAGMLINTVTGEAYDGKAGVVFVPATTQHVFVEWKPRAQGGGFVAMHEVNSPTVETAKAASKEFGKYNVPAKEGGQNDLVETFYVYGVAEDPDGNQFPASLAFKSTQIKKYKGWMTRAKTIQIRIDATRRIPAPLFSHRYRMTTVSDKTPKGTFFSWKIDFDGPDAASARLLPSAELFQAAVGIKAAIESGAARAAVESEKDAGSDDEGGGSGGAATVGNSKPVF